MKKLIYLIGALGSIVLLSIFFAAFWYLQGVNKNNFSFLYFDNGTWGLCIYLIVVTVIAVIEKYNDLYDKRSAILLSSLLGIPSLILLITSLLSNTLLPLTYQHYVVIGMLILSILYMISIFIKDRV